MNKTNLVEILKDCPEGTKLYSMVHGEVGFNHIEIDSEYPIRVTALSKPGLYYNILLTKYGTLLNDYPKGECILFPSKDQRDWDKFTVIKQKFDPETLEPFDKVLVIDSDRSWTPLLFSYLEYSLNYPRMQCLDFVARKVIPYNRETEHLLGTTDEAPEYYRYWED